jgi:hypothetical protein
MNIVMFLLLTAILAVGSTRSAPSTMRGKGPAPVVMHPDTGSDAWGYMWFRSDEPGGPTFNWVDITARGTLVTGLGDDNYVGPFPLLFEFPYYWYTISSFNIGSNGYINFTGSAVFAAPFARLPSTSAVVPKDLFAVCAGDLDFLVTGANGRCYYWTNGADSLVVSFINVTEWQQVSNPNLKHTFQVILNKADSSITYQYGLQQGRFTNSPLCIGWQNQTGQIGCTYTYSSPPHPLLPDSGLAIKIKRVREVPWVLPDAGIVGGFNSGNLARIMRTGIADTIKCVVKNHGNTSLTSVRVRYAITKTGQPTAHDTLVIPSLAIGQQVTVAFPRLFTPAITGTYSAFFNVTIPGDATPSNDSKNAEVLSETFSVGHSTLIRFENGIDIPSTWWYGNGYAIAIDLPPEVYPVRVESVHVKIGSIMNQPMTVQILDGSTGSPGVVLAEQAVTATAFAMNSVDFTSNNVVTTGGRFFVAALGYMEFTYERMAPISYRAWEYINGWMPYRSRDILDFIIRASVRGVTTDVKQVSDVVPDDFVLAQNYPNPFNPTTTVRFSLPSRSLARAEGRAGEGSHISLKVFDLLGREVATLVNENQNPGTYTATWDASGQASGVYFYRLEAGGFVETRKLLLLH